MTLQQKRWLRRLAFVLIGLILLKVLTVTWRSVALWQQVNSLQAAQSPAALTEKLPSLLTAVNNLNGEVGFIYPVLRLFSGDVGTLPDLAAAGVEMGAAAQPLLTLSTAAQRYQAQPTQSNWTNLLQTGRSVDWGEVQAHLREARSHQQHLATIGGASSRITQAAAALDNGLTFAQAAAAAAPDILALLSDGQDHRVAIIAQNNDELRATGGYFTALLIVTIHSDGQIEQSLINSLAVDNLDNLALYPAPPAAMILGMDIHKWLFRDVNWSPDFPTTAKLAIQSFFMGRGQKLDAVATVNLNVIQAVVDAIGPIKVDGVADPLDGVQAITQMRHAWNITPDTISNPDAKDFLKPFITALGDAVLTSDNEGKLSLMAAARELLIRRDVLLYAEDPKIEAVISANGWDGALKKPDGDYLMPVDTNIGYNKVAPYIEQDLAYHVSLTQPDSPFAEAVLYYKNTNIAVPCSQNVSGGTGTYEQRMVACYWDYLRLYTPAGSRLLSNDLQDIPAEFNYTRQPLRGVVSTYTDGSTTQFSGFSLIPANDERTYTLDYSLPPAVIRSSAEGSVYRLLVQKQPGPAPYSFELSIDLPANAQLVSSTPPIAGQSGQTITYEIGQLDRDTEFHVMFKMH